MLEVYKPHTNREAVGVWLCSAAKRPSMRSALVLYIYVYAYLRPLCGGRVKLRLESF